MPRQSDVSFGRQHRLLAKEDFQRVFSHRCKKKHPLCAVFVAPGKAPIARLGLSVPKKQVALASNRNRMKRLIRESFRQTKLPAVDVVVVAYRQASLVENQTFVKALEQLWQRIEHSSNAWFKAVS